MEEKSAKRFNHPTLQPFDQYNQLLQSRVHPLDWPTPTPARRYNFVVVGGGTAGLVSAMGAAGLGAKVALIEKSLLGGDCLNVGCVPSKALLAAARLAHRMRHAERFGIKASNIEIDFSKIMARLREARSTLSVHDSAARFQQAGIDVFFGEARFENDKEISVGESKLRFAKAVIASGGRAAVPPIEGVDTVPYLTNETIFSLEQLPARLCIVGGGPIGCEMAQAFARFGSKVCLLDSGKHILGRDDAAAAAVVRDALIEDGVVIEEGATIERFEGGAPPSCHYRNAQGEAKRSNFDQLLLAVGRRPNVEGLNLEAAGISYDSRGVKVDDRLRTSNPRVFAAGDICLRKQFTHSADAAARIVIVNALFKGRMKVSDLMVPACTYTDPELSQVGVSPNDQQELGYEVDTIEQSMATVDRAQLEGSTAGFLKLHYKRGTDRVVGATLVAEHAGELIHEIALAIQAKVGLKQLSSLIHCYPTQAEVIKKAADSYNRTRLTPFVKRLTSLWLSWVRH